MSAAVQPVVFLLIAGFEMDVLVLLAVIPSASMYKDAWYVTALSRAFGVKHEVICPRLCLTYARVADEYS